MCSRGGGALGAKPTDLKFHVSDRELMVLLQGLLQALDVGTAKLDHFLARNADQVVVFFFTGSFEVAVILLEVCRFNQALLTQKIERPVHGRQANAMPALSRNLKHLVRS
jgi:hypothetical protein